MTDLSSLPNPTPTLDHTRQEAHPFCFVCSASNPMGLALRYTAAPDGSVSATFLGNPALEGYAGLLHGGVVAALADGAMTNCLFAQGIQALTAALHVRYRSPVLATEALTDAWRGGYPNATGCTRCARKSSRPGTSKPRHSANFCVPMNNALHITVLIENSASRRGLKAEHGWACLIEVNGRRVLFDTGQTDLLLDNARALGCALDDLDAIVLSHGHYDHTGGLAAVNALAPAARLFFHPAALAPKYTARADGSADDIGLPATARETLANRDAAVVMTRVSREIVPGLLVTGEIPRQTGFEDVGGRFFSMLLRQADPLLDDQAVFLPTAAGVVVVLRACGW